MKATLDPCAMFFSSAVPFFEDLAASEGDECVSTNHPQVEFLPLGVL